ncbi:hypothetical protein N7536_008994 [Penicillium majusculum]|nr:hypothetical protein N7536_008994 [Penicillium majusculum]
MKWRNAPDDGTKSKYRDCFLSIQCYVRVVSRRSCRSGDNKGNGNDLSGELKLSNSGRARGKSEELAGSYMRNMSGAIDFISFCPD